MRAALIAAALTAAGCQSPAFQMNLGTPTSVEFAEPQVGEPGRLRVAILSDRTTGWPEGLDVLRDVVGEVNEAGPDLVLTVGDMINGYTRHDEDWLREAQEEWFDIIDPLEAPLFPTAGNHDTWPGTHDIEDHSNERLYMEHFGPLYHSFDVERTHFVMLYSDDGLPDGEEPFGLRESQMDWLREDLRDLDADHLFVFMHRPLWHMENSNWAEVHEMLVATGVARAVTAGHNHSYERCPDSDGIAHFIFGVTGGSARSHPLQGGFDHWALLTVEGEAWDLEIRLPGGGTVPNDHVLHEDAEMLRRVAWVRPGETGAVGTLPPVSSLGANPSPLTLRVSNPLEQPVEVHIALDAARQRTPSDDGVVGIGSAGEPIYDTLMRGRVADQWVMDPASVEISLDAESSQEVSVEFSHPDCVPPLLIEPQLNFTYEVEDSRGRAVPVTVRRRIPWTDQRRILAQPNAVKVVDGRSGTLEGWEAGSAFGLPTWQTATWETRETGGFARIAWHGDETLWLFCRFPDDRVEDFGENPSDTILSDALVLRHLDPFGEENAIAIFPHRSDRRALLVTEGTPVSEWPEVEGVEAAAREHVAIENMRLWEISLPATLWLGEGWYERPHLVNVELHDNDGTRWTSVRRWMPDWGPRHWAQIGFGPRPRAVTQTTANPASD